MRPCMRLLLQYILGMVATYSKHDGMLSINKIKLNILKEKNSSA
jgi:hypothetical protein